MAATGAEQAAASASVGNGLAEGLCESVGIAAEKAQASPNEDVRGYLQQSLLPVLGPAVEQLLHYIHESGELQRALREKAEAERAARRQEARKNTNAKDELAAAAAGMPAEVQPQDAAVADAQSEAEANPDAFDPLAWLSEKLRESAAGPTSQYREQIEQRVRQQIAAAEAALLEEAEEGEEGGAGVKPAGGAN